MTPARSALSWTSALISDVAAHASSTKRTWLCATEAAVQVFPSAGFAFGIIRSRRPRSLDALADGSAIATPVACFNGDMLTVIGDDANDVATFERSELSIAMRQRTADVTTDTIADSPSPSRGSFSATSPRALGLRRQGLEVPLDRST